MCQAFYPVCDKILTRPESIFNTFRILQEIKKALHLQNFKTAGDGNRTHVSSLEGWCSTIELHPHD